MMTDRPGREGDRTALRDELVAAGTAAAEQWLTTRTNRHMSEVNRRRLAGHVVGVLWERIEQAAIDMAHWVAADDTAEYEAALDGVHEDRDYWQDRAAEAELALADLRARLGEPKDEWGIDHGSLGVLDASENEAAVLVQARRRGRCVRRRIVGEWLDA